MPKPAKRSSASLSGLSDNYIGAELTEEDIAFGKAVERFKKEYGVRAPTMQQVFYILIGLGYRKIENGHEATS